MRLKQVLTRGVLVSGLFIISLALVPAATAGTLSIQATIHQNLGGPYNSPFTCVAPPPAIPVVPLCGSGEVVGLGQVQEAVVEYPGIPHIGFFFDAWTFADGSVLVLDEIHSNFSCPGNDDCRSFNEHSFGNPFFVTLNATVDGALSTGTFAGATGTLSGQLTVAGGVAIQQLAGPIMLAS